MQPFIRKYWRMVVIVLGFFIDFSIWIYDLGTVLFFGGKTVIDLQLALTLIYVEVPIGVFGAWLISTLFETRREREQQIIELRNQRDLERIKELRISLKTHYKAFVDRTKLWHYYPDPSGFSIFVMTGVVTNYETKEKPIKFEQDLKHLQLFPGAIKLYSAARALAADFAGKDNTVNQVSRTLVDDYVSDVWFIELPVNVIDRLSLNLLIYTRQDSKIREPRRIDAKSIESYLVADVTLEVTEEIAKRIVIFLNDDKTRNKIRSLVKSRDDAFSLIQTNVTGFQSELKSIQETVYGVDFESPELWKGECEDCKLMKQELIKLGGLNLSL